ncbi:SMI1/KNR4 family protein [Streptomyces albipurpureus]|uniref:SMI1/KNR4 family protein n=1 Tax=Streptomyces albipurpureus TaxID=2897419 RepID=A0ABT0UYK1_9ACTN|nr:SMI1/KNR4 family protein [Streptomyces sp. CWNU-1]MCM2393351.1 SMI1/KNR4 family protein [Streptomyces sp. CWNU-1]
MTNLDALTRLVPPPPSPVAADGDWAPIEADLGLRLPTDFKALTGRYGLGQFVDFVSPLNPFSGQGQLQGARRLLEGERRSREKYPEEHPYPYYPEPGGLLVWAGTDNGDRLCWLTEGEPDTWTTVLWNPRGWSYEPHPMGAVAFLYDWLSGNLGTELIAPPPAKPWFDPFVTRRYVTVCLADPAATGPDYPERLRILRGALAPTADRGAVDDGEDARQDHFAALALDWKLTYETAYGHQIRIAYPPADEERARLTLLAAVADMGCTVERVTTHAGAPAWE